MMNTPSDSSVLFKLSPELWVSVGPAGTTNRDYVGGWLIAETAGNVTVSRCPNLDDVSEGNQILQMFKLNETDPVDRAKALARKSFSVILGRCHDEYGEQPLEVEGSVRLEAELIDQSSAPELLVATICDELKEWLSNPVVALPDVEVAIPVVNNEVILEKLKAAADELNRSVVDIIRDVDPEAARLRLLPSLIAAPYTYAMKPGPSFQGRFDGLLKTFEVAVRYLAMIALSPMPDDRKLAFEQLAELRSAGKEFPRKPTLGAYLGIVRERFDRVRTLLPHVGAAMEEPGGKRTALGRYVFDKLAEVRNQQVHGGIMSDAAYVEPAQGLHDNLRQLLVPLARDGLSTVLVVQESVKVPKGEYRYDYSLTELRSDSSGLPSGRYLTNQKLQESKVYLRHDSEFINVDPLVRYDVCPQCHFAEAFFLDHFDERKPQWLSVRGSHRIY